MMLTDSLRIIVLSGVSFRLLLPCRRACSASASAPHFALPPAQPSHVQASCLEHGWPVAIAVFAGALAAGAALPPGRNCRERMREANAEGKIKGCGTLACVKPTCTWGWRGTRQGRLRAVGERNAVSILAKLRASYARLRRPWLEPPHDSS
ncbi:hypothetical protein [Burkholderia pseudomallei]|uniref:hypothetical protein n=1 Tax=Burkholderia pseudomallei TaxID=28450 RepID=UPI0004F7838B|nr:hypothetical protein [Burkholderia pseudomallei]AIP10403.1 hypothetical protein DP55_2735 [Burkholderia pseudomallei]